MIVIVLGNSNSGKDTVTNYILENYNYFLRVSFTRPLKEIIEYANNLPKGALDSPEYKNKRIKTIQGNELELTHLDQLVNAFHYLIKSNEVDSELFIKYALRKISEYHQDNNAGVILSDLRSPYEAQGIIHYAKTTDKPIYILHITNPKEKTLSSDEFLQVNIKVFIEALKSTIKGKYICINNAHSLDILKKELAKICKQYFVN